MRCARIYETGARSVMVSGLRLLLTLLSSGRIPVAPRSLLDNRPLQEFLDRELRLEGIREAIEKGALRGVVVTTSGYTTASAYSFYQGVAGIVPWTRARRKGVAAELSVPHLLASAALPLIFPAQRLGFEFHGDGGMRMVAPLSPAIHLGASRLLVIATRDERPDPEPQAPAIYPSLGEVGGYLLDTIFMDTLNADLNRLRRINHTLSLLAPARRGDTPLRRIDTLVIRPSRDLREVTQRHVEDIPRAVRMLLRTLGGWGRDWRMASYLLFEAPYCRELMDLGYVDAMARRDQLKGFLQGDASDSVSDQSGT